MCHREQTKEDRQTGLKLKTFTHGSGLRVNLIPRHGFSKKFAGITIPLGSVHDRLRTDGRSVRLPAGAAHYMEHCIFSKDENGGLLSTLSSLGANANAYTSFDHTMYYFTSSENFRDILDIYTKAVMSPYLGEDRIEAEREIIIQELEMYRDDPDSRAFNELRSNLYSKHPVKYDIGGTKDSVRRIKANHLNAAKNNCYSPNAAVLTICGEVDEVDIPDLSEFSTGISCGQSLKSAEIRADKEPEGVVRSHSELRMDIAVGSFLAGFRNAAADRLSALPKNEFLRYKKGMDILLDTLIGETSEIYERLFNKGSINDSFGFSAVHLDSASFLVIGSESPVPASACKELRMMLRKVLHEGPDRKMRNDFELKLKMSAGDFIRNIDHIESTGMMQARMTLLGLDIFEYFDIYDNIDINNAFNDLSEAIDDDLSTEVFVLKRG